MGLLCFVRAVGMDIARNKTLVKYITEFPTYKSVSLEGGTMCSRYVRPPFPRRLARFSPDVRRLRHGAVRLLEAGHLEAPGAGPAAADGSGQPGQGDDRQGGRGPRRHRLEDRLRGGGTRPGVRRKRRRAAGMRQVGMRDPDTLTPGQGTSNARGTGSFCQRGARKVSWVGACDPNTTTRGGAKQMKWIAPSLAVRPHVKLWFDGSIRRSVCQPVHRSGQHPVRGSILMSARRPAGLCPIFLGPV